MLFGSYPFVTNDQQVFEATRQLNNQCGQLASVLTFTVGHKCNNEIFNKLDYWQVLSLTVKCITLEQTLHGTGIR